MGLICSSSIQLSPKGEFNSGGGGGKPHEENEITKPTKYRRPRCFKRGKYNKCPKEFDIGGGSEMMLSSQSRGILSSAVHRP